MPKNRQESQDRLPDIGLSLDEPVRRSALRKDLPLLILLALAHVLLDHRRAHHDAPAAV